MVRLTDPLLLAYPGSSWFTIGDGKGGNEAAYIEDMGGQALPSDIETGELEQAKDGGYIREYRRENAERLTFDDESFDFVLCKHALHHMQRPIAALYEMLRVGREAIVLIERQDEYPARPMSWLKAAMRRATGRRLLPATTGLRA